MKAMKKQTSKEDAEIADSEQETEEEDDPYLSMEEVAPMAFSLLEVASRRL